MKRARKSKQLRTKRSSSVDNRIQRLEESVAAGAEARVAGVSYALRDRSPRVRATGVEIVARERLSVLFHALHDALSDRSVVVRAEAVEALGLVEAGSGQHYKDLILRLDDSKPIVRITTIESLTRIRDSRSIRHIKSRLADEDPLVRAYAAIGLTELAGRKFANLISRRVVSEKDEAALAGFLLALSADGSHSKVDELLALLTSKQYRVRCFVANGLARIGLDGKKLDKAVVAVETALRYPIGKADASTMITVLQHLRAKG